MMNDPFLYLSATPPPPSPSVIAFSPPSAVSGATFQVSMRDFTHCRFARICFGQYESNDTTGILNDDELDPNITTTTLTCVVPHFMATGWILSDCVPVTVTYFDANNLETSLFVGHFNYSDIVEKEQDHTCLEVVMTTPPLSDVPPHTSSAASTSSSSHPIAFNTAQISLMTRSWSLDEIAASRRVVCFETSPTNPTVVQCSAVAADDVEAYLASNQTLISCIHWEDKNEHYITSVDLIFLAESLMGQPFSVQDKNRIRRNLEGFHPKTITKTRRDTSEFFKLIMAFPKPKPRNIEKDLKVFLWKDVAEAVKKIIKKYSPKSLTTYSNSRSRSRSRSASPSRTSSPSPTPVMVTSTTTTTTTMIRYQHSDPSWDAGLWSIKTEYDYEEWN